MELVFNTYETFVKAGRNIFGDDYDYEESFFVNVSTPTNIFCIYHGKTFWKRPTDHIRQKQGCPMCAKEYIASGGRASRARLLKVEFVKRSRVKHGYKYGYATSVYITSTEPLEIYCIGGGHYFWQTPHKHMNAGHGCPTCGARIMSKPEFVRRSKLEHGDSCFYDDSLFVNLSVPIALLCLNDMDHGWFNQLPKDHLLGHGCPKCGRARNGLSRMLSKEEIVKRFRKVHGDSCCYKDSKYTGYWKKMGIRCNRDKTHGTFESTPANHIQGASCPRCVQRGWSKISMTWLKFMEIRLGTHIKHALNGGELRIKHGKTCYSVDGYEPKSKTVLEFHGDYWHGNPNIYDPDVIQPTTKMTYGQLYERTLVKESKLKSMGYGYVCIWESEWRTMLAAVSVIQSRWRQYMSRKRLCDFS